MAIDYSQFTKTDTGRIGPDGKPIFDIFQNGNLLKYEQAIPFFQQGLNVDFIQGAKPLNLPPQNPQDNVPGMIVAGADAWMTELQKYLNPPSDDKTRADQLTSEVDKYLGEATGRGQAQLDAEAKLGIPDTKKQLADLNADIARKIAEYNAAIVKNSDQPILGSIVAGQNDKIARFAAADIGILQAQALGLQGQLSAAQESADRAIDLMYQDKLDLIDTKLKQLELIKGRLSDSEKTRMQALELSLQDQRDQLSLEVSNKKDQTNTLLNLLQTYPDAGITLNDTVESAALKVATKSKLYADRFSSGGGTLTERTRTLEAQAVSDAMPILMESKRGGQFIDGNVFWELRNYTLGQIGTANLFDDAFIGQLSPSDRAKYGLGKAVGVEAQPSDESRFLSKDYFRGLYTPDTLKQAAKDQDMDTEEYLNYLDNLVNQYRSAGYTDKEILKMMQ